MVGRPCSEPAQKGNVNLTILTTFALETDTIGHDDTIHHVTHKVCFRSLSPLKTGMVHWLLPFLSSLSGSAVSNQRVFNHTHCPFVQNCLRFWFHDI